MADFRSQVPDPDCRQAFVGVKKAFGEVDEAIASTGGNVASLASVAYIVRPTVTASTPNGIALMDGAGTLANYGTPGRVGLDVKIGFDVPFFSLATPEAI